MLVSPGGSDPSRPEPDFDANLALGLTRSGAPSTQPTQRLPKRSARRRGRKRHLSRRFKSIPRDAIFCIDWVLRRWYGVHEFSFGRDDLLRAAVRHVKHDLVLPDGTRIAAGDAIADLHIWNERVLGLGPSGSDLGWASRVRRRIDCSLTNLAICMEADPSLQSCKALRADTVFTAGHEATTALRIAGRLGLSLRKGGTASLGESLVGFALVWACNPHSLSGKPFRRMRNELWISRAAFLERYSAAWAAASKSPTEDGSSGAESASFAAGIAPVLVAEKSKSFLRPNESSGEPQP